MIGEVLENGDSVVVARGGRGGKGNACFATSTHQAPARVAARRGRARRAPLELELKLIADVGLVGQPNAGKSTLLSVISRRPAEDRRLSVHHAVAEPRRRAAERRPHVRRRRHPGHHRRRARREGARPPVPAAHRAHAPARVPHSHRLAWTGRPSTTSCAARSRSTRRSSREKPHCVVFTKMDLLGEDEPPPIEAPDAFGVFADQRARRARASTTLAAWWRELLQMRKATIEPDARRRAALTWTLHRGDAAISGRAARTVPSPPRTLWAARRSRDPRLPHAWPSSARGEPRRTRSASPASWRGARACRRVRRQRPRARHRRGGASRCARGAGRDGRRARHRARRVSTRRRTRRSSATSRREGSCSPSSLPTTPAHRGSFPKRQSHHRGARATHDRRGGAGKERRADHRRPCARAGSYGGGGAGADRRSAGAGQQRAASRRRHRARRAWPTPSRCSASRRRSACTTSLKAPSSARCGRRGEGGDRGC